MGSTLVIGHPYLSIYDENYIFDPGVKKLIDAESEKISNVIFTGDVLVTPKPAQWDDVKRFFYEVGVDLFIAPGNHDVGDNLDNKFRQIFSEAFGNPQYKTILLNKSLFIIEDSTKTNWVMNEKIIEIIQKSKLENPNIEKAYIFRHQAPVTEALKFINSRQGLSPDLHSISDLTQMFNHPVTIISGDGGAFNHLPRIACLQNDQVDIVINGIGKNENDIILIIQNNEIQTYKLGPYVN